MDAVHIVALENFPCAVHDEIAHLGVGGIQIPASVVLHYVLSAQCRVLVPLPECICHIHFLQLGRRHAAQWVDPCVNRQSPRACLLDEDGERVVRKIVRITAGYVGTWCVEIRGVKTVRIGTHLYNYSVEPVVRHVLQDACNTIAEIILSTLTSAVRIDLVQVKLREPHCLDVPQAARLSGNIRNDRNGTLQRLPHGVGFRLGRRLCGRFGRRVGFGFRNGFGHGLGSGGCCLG